MVSHTGRAIVTISELTRIIKARIEADPLLQQCFVRGEISNFTRHTSGHLYFTLKDDTSRIKSVMFKGSARFLSFQPKDGMKVIARGNVSVFERDGSYQLYVDELQPDGLGALHLAYEQMKERLAAEGLFSAERKRALPKYPAAIGVVTSPTGAAVRDIITTIKRRYPIAHVILYPVLVQGTGSAASVAKAIQEMNRMMEVDVLIVGRGGGSLEELWAFNEEVVARAIFNSQIPVISAVGHETDFTIADFVADVRAATPTAAAELAVPVFAEMERKIDEWKHRLRHRITAMVSDRKRTLEQLAERRSLTHPLALVDRRRELLDHLSRNLEVSLLKRSTAAKSRVQEWVYRLSAQSPKNRMQGLRERIFYLQNRTASAAAAEFNRQQNRLDQLLIGLDAYNPLNAMRRGYSLVYQPEDKQQVKRTSQPRLVRKLTDVSLGDIIAIRLQNGWLDCQVWGMREETTNDGTAEESRNERANGTEG